ncbi:lasso RiPP family leader peptide-containing protein [Brevundimonas nasdae]|nr:lasso RiPP family leader peptide-containing protein [Brevundimonas nasdae]
MTNAKTVYEAPAMTSLGSFETLTQGASRGSALDATFPTGTPFGDLTFS